MLKVSFEKPKLDVAEEVRNLFRKKKDKKDAPPKFWTHKERIVVGAILALSIIGSAIFYYQGQGKLPSINIGGFGFGETVILEK